ncbi:sialidase family protein [Clostridium oryzae]|uniref:BNR/Asp-box repeat protein n=1 Tax=Clostridium oryzae TaxID=1450648 RepID=A0A1V4IF03_9CLOT|nr:sialidase family protein [Clostridium oryzae]OPJ58430.1 BNR/Asp-box repeat protein [Clostridium oryzae]
MATQTPNLGLTKSDLNETADISVINANMDIIDVKYKELQEDVKVTSVNSKTGTVVLSASDINAADGSSIETRLADLANQPKADMQARSEIMDIKLKLKEQASVSFINKTGVGFYDTFADNSQIDTGNTTATYDNTNKLVSFADKGTYTAKTTSAYTNASTINVDTEVKVGDKIDNTNEVTAVNPKETNDITVERTDITVVGSAYFTGHNNSRRLVKLDNNWLISAVIDTVNNRIRFFVSKDNGATWMQICYINAIAVFGLSLAFKGTFVYTLVTYNVGGESVDLFHFDATTVSDDNLSVSKQSITNCTSSFMCSLAINPVETKLHACWSSENSTFSSNYNIGYCEGTISLDGNVTWGAVEQVTTFNNANYPLFAIFPCIVFDKNNIPCIFIQQQNVCLDATSITAKNGITLLKRNTTLIAGNGYVNSNWSYKVVYNGGGFIQGSPSAIYVPRSINELTNGRIWVTWDGRDSTDTDAYNIQVVYSDDGGLTWSSPQKLTSGNSYAQAYPSITCNKNNEIFIVWYLYAINNSTFYRNIRKIKYANGVWTNITTVTNNTTGDAAYPSVLFDNTFSLDFSEPLFVYQNLQTSKVGFYGTWIADSITYDITVTTPITTTNGQALTLYKVAEKLKMLPQTFGNFKSLELNVYPNKISKATIKGAVNNSTTVLTNTAVDKKLYAGDKLFVNGAKNEIVSSTNNYGTNTINDATIIGNSNTYDINNNGGRKLVRLNDGTLFSCTRNSTHIYIYKSVDNGATWGTFTAIGHTSVQDICLATDGVHLFVLENIENVAVHFLSFSGDSIITNVLVDTSQTTINRCSLIVNSGGTELHTCWISENSACHGYNVRYAKGIIASDGSVVWGMVEQVTTWDVSNYPDFILYPSITLDKNNIPCIFVSQIQNALTESTYQTGYAITLLKRDSTLTTGNSLVNSNWSYRGVYFNSSQSQVCPSAIYIPQSINGLANGRIWVTWYGYDSIDTGYGNIKVSYSDDLGATWSAPQKLTSGNIYHQCNPSITANKNNEIFIVWQGFDSTISTSNYNIRKIKYSDGTWGSITNVTINTTESAQFPNTLFDNTFTLDFSEPLFIYQNMMPFKIGFYGTWIAWLGYNLIMTNPVTLADGDKVTIVDIEAKQTNVDIPLVNIDSEKFVYKADNLDTTIADLLISAVGTRLNGLEYAIG